MDRSPVSRWAPLLGVLTPILWFVGILVGESGDVPEDDATADAILAYFQNETGSILLGAVLFMLGALTFVLFASVLRSRWRTLGASETTSSLAFGTALVGSAFLAATWAPQLGVGVAVEDMGAPIAPATAEAAWHISTGFFVVGELFLALFFFSTAAITMAVPVLPKWLGWIGVVLGAVALVPPIGWAAIVFGMPLWLLLAGIIMTIRAPMPAKVPL